MAGIDLLNSLSGKGIDYGSVISVTAAATLDAAALGRIVVCSGTSADYTVVLPPVSESAGKRLLLMMDSALTRLVTIDGNAAETIDGAANRIMWAGEVAELWCDGIKWRKLSCKSIPMICRMYKFYSTAQSINHQTITQVLVDTASITTAPQMVSSGSNRINIVRPSRYRLMAGLNWHMTTGSYNHSTQCRIHKNGSEQVWISFGYYLKTITPVGSINVNTQATASLVAGDYLSLHAYHVASSAETLVLAANETDMHAIEATEIISW